MKTMVKICLFFVDESMMVAEIRHFDKKY